MSKKKNAHLIYTTIQRFGEVFFSDTYLETLNSYFNL